MPHSCPVANSIFVICNLDLRTYGILDLTVDRAKFVSEELLSLVKEATVGAVRNCVGPFSDNVSVVLRTAAVPGKEL